MLKISIITLLVSSIKVFSCTFLISEVDCCEGASNGLRRFWEHNENSKFLLQQQNHLNIKQKTLVEKTLKENPDPLVQSVVRDFTKDKEKFYSELQSSIEFVEQHLDSLKARMGDVPAKNLYTRLMMLNNLIYELYLQKTSEDRPTKKPRTKEDSNSKIN